MMFRNLPSFMSIQPLRQQDGGGGGGGGNADANANANAGAWYESADLGLEDDVKTHLAGKNFPDIKTALRSGFEADTLARSRNVLPAFDPEKAADWAGWEKLGWTPDRQKYAVEKPDVPENVTFDEAMFNTYQDLAHEHRIPVAAAKAVYDGMFKHMTGLMSEFENKGAADSKTLNDQLDADWGADAQRNREIAKRAMSTFGIGADDAAELEKVVGAARLVKMFHGIGAKIGEDSLVTGQGGGGGALNSAAQVRAEMARLKGDEKFVASLKDARNPQHADNTAAWQKLTAQLAKFETM